MRFVHIVYYQVVAERTCGQFFTYPLPLPSRVEYLTSVSHLGWPSRAV